MPVSKSLIIVRFDPTHPVASFFVRFMDDERHAGPRNAGFEYSISDSRWYGKAEDVAYMCARTAKIWPEYRPVNAVVDFTIEAWAEFQARLPNVKQSVRAIFEEPLVLTRAERIEADCQFEVDGWIASAIAQREANEQANERYRERKRAERTAAAAEKQRKSDEENAATMAHLVGAAAEEIDAAYDAMKILASYDTDHATYLNGRGFGHAHTKIGHRLSKLTVRRRQPLDDAFALKLARLHRGQLPPELANRVGRARA